MPGQVGGNPDLWRKCLADIERAQAEVRANEKLLRTLIDHSVNGILRLRWIEEEGEDFRKLRCVFANAMAGIGAGALYDLTDSFSVGLSGSWDDDTSSVLISGRWYFGR